MAETLSAGEKAALKELAAERRNSGRRAGIAKDTMTSMGFSTLINAGAIGDASSATGLPIVQ